MNKVPIVHRRATRRLMLGALAGISSGMAMPIEDFTKLPANLPVPLDDGACDHLPGMEIPDLALMSTRGVPVNLRKVNAKRVVVYAYPMTGVPGKDIPPGWNDIPGARGCTPQSCSMRDHYHEMKQLGAEVFGLSTQTTEYQQEMATRLHLPYEVLSDHELRMTEALKLPTFSVQGMTLMKRLTLVIRQGKLKRYSTPCSLLINTDNR
jgi:peroxiredoxin